MNAKIEKQRAFKRRFGITIHENMGIKELIKAWDKVPDITKQLASAEFLLLMDKLSTVEPVIDEVTKYYGLAQQAYEVCGLAIDAGVAIMAGQPQQPLLQMGVKTAKDVMINTNSEVISILGSALDKAFSQG